MKKHGHIFNNASMFFGFIIESYKDFPYAIAAATAAAVI